MVMSAMLQIFSRCKSWNILLNKANKNICTTTQMKNIHYFFYLTSKVHLQCLINLYIILEKVKVMCQVKGHPSELLNTELYHFKVLLHPDITLFNGLFNIM